LGDDEQINLGADGWWDFGFQGCTAFETETVALIDPVGGPTGDAFQAPTGYECSMDVDGDTAGPYTNQIGGTADTGGKIFINSSHAYPNTTSWTITCNPL